MVKKKNPLPFRRNHAVRDTWLFCDFSACKLILKKKKINITLKFFKVRTKVMMMQIILLFQ